MDEEIQVLQRNHTWDLTELLAGKEVGCRREANGTLDRFKAGLVAKGHSQTLRLDYINTFSPVAKLNLVRILLSLAANHNWPLHQLDVYNAFLH